MNAWRDLLTKDQEKANILFASISYDNGVSVEKGASEAPKRLRELSSHLPAASKDGISLSSIKLFDFGDIGDNSTDFSEIEKKAYEIFQLKKFSIFLGGDHSCSIPIQKAFYQYYSYDKIPAIIHIDAHPDICDVYHDSKLSHACTNYRALDEGYKMENIKLLAIRGFEQQEINLFKKHPEIEVIKATDIRTKGLDSIKHLKDKFSDQFAIYLSFDIDALDPSYAPGTGTPEAFGLTSFETLEVLSFLIEHLPVKAMDIMEISPRLDVNDITSWTALKILYEIFAIILKKEKYY